MENVGFDIAKRKFDLLWLAEKTGKSKAKAFDNTAGGHADVLAWLAKQGINPANCHIAMEATSQYWEALATVLFDAGYTVSVVNPLQIKSFGDALMRRQKTDKADAALIARFCAQTNPPAWRPAPAEVRELQRLIARLEAVTGMHVQEQNRRHEAAGIALESVERVADVLVKEELLLKKLIHDHIDRHPDLREQHELLTSIPGVGESVSSNFMAWLPAQRLTVRQAVAFVGLSPSHRQSGDSVHGKSHLSKLGHARLRRALYLPAMCAIQHNPAAKAIYLRLRATGKGGKVALVAVMRKMVHWMVAVLKSKKPFDPNLALAKQA